jgi:hypothetical protein
MACYRSAFMVKLALDNCSSPFLHYHTVLFGCHKIMPISISNSLLLPHGLPRITTQLIKHLFNRCKYCKHSIQPHWNFLWYMFIALSPTSVLGVSMLHVLQIIIIIIIIIIYLFIYLFLFHSTWSIGLRQCLAI